MTDRFGGEHYVEEWDEERLAGGMAHIRRVMSDHQWRTLEEIREAAPDVPLDATSSRHLRYLREARFGAYTVEVRRRKGGEQHGVFEYRVGEPGTHVHKKSAAAQRAERAEEIAASLAAALAAVDPTSNALKLYRSLYGDVAPSRARHRVVTRRPRESETEPSISAPRAVPTPRHTAPEAKSLKRFEPKPKRRGASSVQRVETPARPQLSPEEKEARRQARLERDLERARAARG